MTFRKILFWSHLVAGVAAGFFILFMSITGVLLTYENVLIEQTRRNVVVENTGSEPIPLSELATLAAEKMEGDASLTVFNKANSAIYVSRRGAEPVLLNPYTGETVKDPAHGMEEFFGTVMRLHRWLGMEGDARDTGRAITGAANLVFLFIVISGLYLWLPKFWRWSFIKLNLFFRRGLPSSKARDFNWHHVFGIWALIPLFFIVISGAVISYPWASNLVYKVAGEEPPQRGRGPGGPSETDQTPPSPVTFKTSVQTALDAAILEAGETWKSARLSVPISQTDTDLDIVLYRAVNPSSKFRTTYTFDRQAAAITQVQGFSDMSRGRQLRTWMRFIHTGEQYGLIGMTIAGLATLAACFLVYTGLALSFRRLILPLFRRRKRAKV